MKFKFIVVAKRLSNGYSTFSFIPFSSYNFDSTSHNTNSLLHGGLVRNFEESMNLINLVPVIMAGGSGTRLWPLSRTAYPKQFLLLGNDKTMLQQTVARLDGISGISTFNVVSPIIITNEDHRFLVAEQLRERGARADILLEPVGKNTAPAIALAAFKVMADYRGDKDKTPVLLVLASDHLIKDTPAFHKSVNELLPYVQSGKFGTLGIIPDQPATGYGYVKKGSSNGACFEVQGFIEKPDLRAAQAYLESGEYLWNSGMFMFRADRYLEELKNHRPDIYSACEKAISNPSEDMDFIRVDAEAFKQCPDESIDYAVMEPLCAASDSVLVSPLDAGWSDVGSWSALWEVSSKDAEGNAVICGQGAECQTMLTDTKDCMISTSDRLVVTIGLEDLVIVDTKDALLVATKDKVDQIKSVVARIKQDGGTQHQFHRQVYRPWGCYDSIDFGERYQVKRITVKPGAKLSVQKHHHRAEHWVVVSGTAQVTNGDKTFLVTENESTFIPIGQVHALENPGKVPLEMIEVQSGSYLGEDDIVRFEDKYGRV